MKRKLSLKTKSRLWLLQLKSEIGEEFNENLSYRIDALLFLLGGKHVYP